MVATDIAAFGLRNFPNEDINKLMPFITSGVAHSINIGDKNTYDDFDLVITDWGLKPPAPKTNYTDIPGGNGSIDTTSLVPGDVVYEDRTQTFTFQLLFPENYEQTKTELSNYFHGQRFDYTLDIDPGYTYNGRFKIDSYDSVPNKGIIKVNIRANPYKVAENYIFSADAARGATFILPSGRRPVSPIFETKWITHVQFEGITYVIYPGTTRIRDIWLKQGNNEIYVNSWPDGGSQVWNDLRDQGVTWAEFATKRVVDWRWGDAEPTEERLVYITYAREDL